MIIIYFFLVNKWYRILIFGDVFKIGVFRVVNRIINMVEFKGKYLNLRDRL